MELGVELGLGMGLELGLGMGIGLGIGLGLGLGLGAILTVLDQPCVVHCLLQKSDTRHGLSSGCGRIDYQPGHARVSRGHDGGSFGS